MPEGDTIFRSAVMLRRWLQGRVVTSVTSAPSLSHLGFDRLTGSTIEVIDSRGKHLLMRFSSDLVVHTHMRMTGSWHLYRAGEVWTRPRQQARLVIEFGDRFAVCFNAPVVELLTSSREHAHSVLKELGPDVVADNPFDIREARRRSLLRPDDTPIGVVLLDQRVVSGIGNIYRSEILFAQKTSPWLPMGSVTDEAFAALMRSATQMMRAATHADGLRPRFVYRRVGKPCRICGSPVRSRRLGDQPRTVYWCVTCQSMDST